MTLEQIGQHFGITKERVRQINVRGMKQLREWAAKENVGSAVTATHPAVNQRRLPGVPPVGGVRLGGPCRQHSIGPKSKLCTAADREEPDRSQDADAKRSWGGRAVATARIRPGSDRLCRPVPAGHSRTGVGESAPGEWGYRECRSPPESGIPEPVRSGGHNRRTNRTSARIPRAECGPEGSAPGCVV